MSRCFLMTCAALAISVGTALAEILPPDVAQEPWFSRCQGLSADRKTLYPSATRVHITYAWQTDRGYLWDWENGAQAVDTAHYCTRAALYDRKNRLIAHITMLCSVNGRGKSTEVWMLGNAEVAKRLCPMGAKQLKAMDIASSGR